MSFKKYKIKKTKEDTFLDSTLDNLKSRYMEARRKNFSSSIFLWIIWVWIVVFLAFFTFNKISNFSLDFNFLKAFNLSWLSSIDPQKEKINILLTWVGWWSHEWTNLTDTIILASLNVKKKTVSLFSIPRDLYVAYPTWWAWRINELYSKWLKVYSQWKAMTYLQEKVEEITWEKTDYYLNIDFDWFVKFVDLLWWVEIDVPKDLIDTEYPDDNWWYETFKIKKWKQILNWKTALKYARSRHSTNDFDRSLRQQLVIKAIKSKLISLDFIWSPSKLKSLFYTLNANIKTSLSIWEIISLAAYAKEIPNWNIFSFNLNTSCDWWENACEMWGFLYTPARDLFGGASVILPEDATPGNISQYTSIMKYANLAINYPEISQEKLEINFVNSLKVSWLANKFAIYFKKYWFNVPDKDSVFSTKETKERTYINYKYNNQTKVWVNPESKTLEAISWIIFGEQKVVNKLEYSTSPFAKIEIVIWKDYNLFIY